MNDYLTFYSFSKTEKEIFSKPEDLVRFYWWIKKTYPHISVNIGSGVSILLVNSINDVKRVSGTNVGGGIFYIFLLFTFLTLGTLIGLSKLLVDVDNYDELMKMASYGDNTNLDLLIKDIYGEGVKPHNLDEDIIASR